jgi:predicted nuclease of restriction endonuclease-like (RecB) superfamily
LRKKGRILKRAFYIIEAIENSWSVRELDRQINSALYERLSLSRDKEKVKELSIK